MNPLISARAFMRLAAPLLLLVSLALPAQQPADLEAIHKQAIAAYDKHDYPAALPLYEILLKDKPSSVVYQERVAACLLVPQPGDTEASHRERLLRARKLLLQAQAGGDNSSLVQILLEKTADLETAQPSAANRPPEQDTLDQAEVVFGKGDFAGALVLYKKALEINPNSYAAALFAGDAAYKLGHQDEAGVWYAKAIAINSDIETAYRYWGDTLEKSGHHQEAEQKFILAVIHQPYQKAPRLGLKQWADANHATIAAPPISLPNHPATGKDGHINITLPMSSKQNEPDTPVLMAYSINAAAWQAKTFRETYPKEAKYRDSLPEEVDNIHAMLKVAGELKLPDDKMSTSLKLLKELDRQDMLECWILLDHANNDLVADYAPYARTHVDLMAQYVAKYDVHLH